MKLLRPLGIAFVLLLLLVATAAGQDGGQSDNEELGWGLRLVFAPSTTITDANELRLEYNLEMRATPYVAADGTHIGYRYDDNSEYASYARFYWSDSEHAGCSAEPGAERPCPLIHPLYGYYSPVSEGVEAQLRQDSRIAEVQNANNPTFFLRAVIRGIIQVPLQRWGDLMNAFIGQMG